MRKQGGESERRERRERREKIVFELIFMSSFFRLN